jgi:hypothetical protein
LWVVDVVAATVEAAGLELRDPGVLHVGLAALRDIKLAALGDRWRVGTITVPDVGWFEIRTPTSRNSATSAAMTGRGRNDGMSDPLLRIAAAPRVW